MVWWWAVTWVVSLVVMASVMRPRSQATKPAAFAELNVPVAEVGKEIPVVFGTCTINSPNVVWYGDFSTTAIRQRGGKK